MILLLKLLQRLGRQTFVTKPIFFAIFHTVKLKMIPVVNMSLKESLNTLNLPCKCGHQKNTSIPTRLATPAETEEGKEWKNVSMHR